MPGHLTVVVSGSERQVEQGTTAGELLEGAGPANGPEAVVVARVGGELRDLAHVVVDGDVVEPVTMGSPDGLAVLRHSTAHVLAQAVQEVFPGARLGIGPPVTDGFYYDFDVETPFTPEDLKKLSSVMQRIVKEGQSFSRRAVSDDDAREELAAEPYKLELIGLKGSAGQDVAEAAEGADAEVGGGELTIYDNLRRDGALAWKDLCRGPHLPTTRLIGNGWSLTRTAAAYWRGSEKNPQLQRVYGTAWPTKDELVAYKDRLAEAERRDHRKLGAELDLFSFPDEIGSGLAVFHPQRRHHQARDGGLRPAAAHRGGLRLRRHPAHRQGGRCSRPPGTCRTTPRACSPRWSSTRGAYRIKAMNCPMHNLIYRSRGRSYRELPLRLFEFGHVYRYEKSGVVHGLTRVRGFAQDDSHSYVTEEQAPGEVQHLLDFCLSLFRDFGLDDFYLELSTRDDAKKDKFIGSDEEWAVATQVLEDVARGAGLELVPDPGGAAYYGPKISVQARDAIGRTWQMSTIQYDFNQPRGSSWSTRRPTAPASAR